MPFYSPFKFDITVRFVGKLIFTIYNVLYNKTPVLVYDEEYANMDTLPGVISTSYNSHSIETKFRNVEFYDGSLANTAERLREE